MALRAKFEDTEFSVGDKVSVYQKIKEAEKTRSQVFEGVVIAIRGEGVNKTFTVRGIASGGIGVERIWPLYTPWISKIKVKAKGKVRRAKLYYLRRKVGKEALRVKRIDRKAATLKTQKLTEGTEKPKKSQRSLKTSVSSVSRRRIRAKTTLGKIGRKSRRRVSSK